MRNRWQRLMDLLSEQLRLLLTISPSDRRWQMPFAAALTTGLPLFVGAWFDRLDYGLVSSLGGLVFLYLPATPLSHRMVTLMACAFGMLACYTLGHGSVSALIEARFYDTLLGCLVGLVGAMCLHNPSLRRVFGNPMRRMIPARFGARTAAPSEE